MFNPVLVGWLVVLGLNDPLRQYFSLYRVISQREGEREEKGQMRAKMSKQPPPAPTARAVGPCPIVIQTSRTPRHWKFTQDHRTTRPSPFNHVQLHVHWMHLLITRICRYTCIDMKVYLHRYSIYSTNTTLLPCRCTVK